MIKHIKTDLKIFKFDYEEVDCIAANNIEEAKRYWLNDLGYEEEGTIEEQGVIITELKEDCKDFVLLGDDENLTRIVNEYRNEKDKKDSINIWDMLISDLMQYKLSHDREMEIPFLISTTNY